MNNLQGIIISLLTAAIVGCVTGGIVMYRQVGTLEVAVDGLHEKILEETERNRSNTFMIIDRIDIASNVAQSALVSIAKIEGRLQNYGGCEDELQKAQSR